MPSTPKAKDYKFVGDRAMILEGGRPIGPGEYVSLTDAEITGITQTAINDGNLIDATGAAPAPEPPPPTEGE